MKIKRFENLWTMGIILIGVILIFVYLLKICMPNFVVETAQIESVSKIGHYIDNNKWAWFLATFIVSFAMYYFIIGASCRKKVLNRKELLLIVGTILILFFVKEVLPAQYQGLNISSMILLPCICKADFKATTFVFVATTVLQTMSIEIRNIGMRAIDFNYATFLILMIDYYIAIVFMYLLFNYRKEK